MKKFILSLLLCIMAAMNLSAQTKTQVLSDLRFTMDDFIADLNYINEDRINYTHNLSLLAKTFGYAEYFHRNGNQMESFRQWIESYCSIQLKGELIQHSATILERTFKKVDPNQKEDRRYKFDITFKRKYNQNNSAEEISLPDETLTFTVLWHGPGQYLSILAIDGKISPLPVMAADKGNAKAKEALDKITTGSLYTPKKVKSRTTKTFSGNAGQTYTATGQVFFEDKSPAFGATVIIKGTNNGVIADFDGNFEISKVKIGDTIIIDFVGYKTYDYQFDGKHRTITLQKK